MTGAHPLQHPHHMQRSAARRLGSSLGGDPPQQRAACKVDAEAASRRIDAACTRLGHRPPANQDNTGRGRAALAYYYAPSSSHRQLISAGMHSYCHAQHRSTQPGMRRQEDDSPPQITLRLQVHQSLKNGPRLHESSLCSYCNHRKNRSNTVHVQLKVYHTDNCL